MISTIKKEHIHKYVWFQLIASTKRTSFQQKEWLQLKAEDSTKRNMSHYKELPSQKKNGSYIK